MVRRNHNLNASQKGIALVVALLFLAIFGAFAAAMASMSSSDVEMAANQTKGNKALMSAQSGAEMVRYLLEQVRMHGGTSNDQTTILNAMATELQTHSSGSPMAISLDGTTIDIPSVTLDASSRQSFAASISYDPTTTSVSVDVTGRAADKSGVGSRDITRKVRQKYQLSTRRNSVFNFGVATKGPLSLIGNVGVEGVNLASEGDVYIESLDNNVALTMQGKAHIAGEVSIVNAAAVPSIGNVATIGGAAGEAARANVDIGVDPVEFPLPDATYFKKYATGTTYATSNSLKGVSTLTNATIGPGVNPKFTGPVTIEGILYVKKPNVVDFGGNVTVTGLIVCEGDFGFDAAPASNSLVFRGTVDSRSVTDLMGEQYANLKKETGTFLLAPGFKVSMGGNFGTLNGAIASNGIEFFGSAGGTIAGSVINYSPIPMTLTGSSDLQFNRSGIDDSQIPAGFNRTLIYDASTYEEPSI